jgi:hypothetical protein
MKESTDMHNNPMPRFVPKVHPATRDVAADDPMSIHATAVPGDPDLMLRAVVQEFGGMGWDFPMILALFHDPDYPVLHALGAALGETEIRRRIAAILETQGVYRFHCTIQEAPEEPEVIQIERPPGAHRSRRENHHAPGL